MTKQECVNLIKLLKYCYPAFFKTRTKEQFVNFANAFISEFEEFDYKLADHAVNKLISKRYKEKNKYCPNIIEMKQSVWIVNSLLDKLNVDRFILHRS